MSYALSPALAADSLKGRGLAVGTDRADTGLGSRAYLPIDLRALTAEAFGYSPLYRFQLPAEHGQQSNGEYYADQVAAADTSKGFNMFGLPVFAQVTLQGATNPITNVHAAGMRLLDPILTVDAPMNVVKTPVQGRRGTVKEYIGQGDYGVTIRAILATDTGAANRFAYPLPLVHQLRALCELGVALPVSGFLLDTYGIKNLVVENVRYESLPGFVNLQAYELQCVSDEPIELAY